MVEEWCWGKTGRFLFSSASILLQQPIGHPSQSLQPSPSLHTISPPISISNFSSKCICPKYKMYLSEIQNVFVRNTKCICPNWKMYSSKLENVFHTISTNHLAHLSFISNLSSKCICPKYKMYSSKIQNVFVLIRKYISHHCYIRSR